MKEVHAGVISDSSETSKNPEKRERIMPRKADFEKVRKKRKNRAQESRLQKSQKIRNIRTLENREIIPEVTLTKRKKDSEGTFSVKKNNLADRMHPNRTQYLEFREITVCLNDNCFTSNPSEVPVGDTIGGRKICHFGHDGQPFTGIKNLLSSILSIGMDKDLSQHIADFPLLEFPHRRNYNVHARLEIPLQVYVSYKFERGTVHTIPTTYSNIIVYSVHIFKYVLSHKLR